MKKYGGCANLLKQTSTDLIYEYCAYKKDDGETECDGRIIIDKDSLEPAESRVTTRRHLRRPNEIVQNNVPVVIPYIKLFSEKKILIENCSNCWKEKGGNDFIAVKLVFEIFNGYQETGKVPKEVHYEV